MKERLTVKEARKAWLRIIHKNLNGSIYDSYLSTVLPKLKRLKFTYGGQVKKGMTKNKSFIPDKNYLYIQRHFPSLIRQLEKEIEGLENR